MKNATARINIDGMTSGLWEAATRLTLFGSKVSDEVFDFLVDRARDIDETRAESVRLAKLMTAALENHLDWFERTPTASGGVGFAKIANGIERTDARLFAKVEDFAMTMRVAVIATARGPFSDEVVTTFNAKIVLLSDALRANLDLSSVDCQAALARFETALAATS